MRALKLAAALTILISTAQSAEHFPLQYGNFWTYRSADTGETFTVRVGLPYLINERVYNQLTGYTPQPLLVRLNEDKELLQLDQETGLEQKLTSFEPTRMGWWEAPSRACEQEGQTLPRRITHDGPAGPVADVLEIRYRVFGCADTGVESEQYAENIGMLRRTLTTFAGPRKFDLVYARISKGEINATPRGTFSVSQENTPQGDVTAVLRLKIDGDADVNLAFPSGQEYEVVLSDQFGNTLWKWSDGRVFTEGSHERTLLRDWVVMAQIPRSVLPVTSNSQTKYFVQAWLTTTGTTHFASTVPYSVVAAARP